MIRWKLEIVAMLVIALLWFTGESAFAEDTAPIGNTATLTGRVTDEETGSGIADVNIFVTRRDAEGRTSVTTDADGRYTVANLAAGVYQVTFSPPLPYYAENYNDLLLGWGAPNLITVAEGATVNGIDAALRKGLVISGTVTASEDGRPLPNVSISATGRGSPNPFTSATTAVDGTFALGPLWPDEYLLFFRSADSHASAWYNSASSVVNAKWLTVTTDVTDLAIELVPGGHVRGHITDPSGQPAQFASVAIYPADGSTPIANGFADADGNYISTPGLPEGWYQVEAVAAQLPGTARTWYSDTVTQESSQWISVSAGITVPNVDIQLQTLTNTGAISGTVSDAMTTTGVAATVTLYDTDRRIVATQFAANGRFAFNGLPVGEYRVQFGGGSDYGSPWYDGQVALAAATPVVVQTGQTTILTQSLQRTGGISGTVTAASGGMGIPGTQVQIWPIATATFTPTVPVATTTTGLNGHYHATGVIPDAYRLRFLPPSPYLRTWFDSSDRYMLAQAVTVSANATTADIDVTVQTGTVVTGIVQAAENGEPLPGITVIARAVNAQTMAAGIAGNGPRICEDELPDSLLDAESERMFGNATMAGVYALLMPLDFAAFIICADPSRTYPSFFSQYYYKAATASEARPINNDNASELASMGLQLERGSQVKMRVIEQVEEHPSQRDRPLAGVVLRYEDPRTLRYEEFVSDANGIVNFPALPAGQYRITAEQNGREKQEITIEVDGKLDVCPTITFRRQNDFKTFLSIVYGQ